MKKGEFRISQITVRDASSTMTPAEYSIWKANWDRLWDKLIGEALHQAAEDKRKEIKIKTAPKSELVKRSIEMAEQLDIKLPRSFSGFYYDDVYFIKFSAGNPNFQLGRKAAP